jgi:hypothetical protein
MLGFAVEGARTASPRLYFEETVLPGPHINAEQAQGYVLCNLAYLARLDEDLDEAWMLVDEAISTFTMLGDRDGESLALNHWAACTGSEANTRWPGRVGAQPAAPPGHR